MSAAGNGEPAGGEPATPERAADVVRERARAAVAAGEYADAARLEALGATERSALDRLQEWATIEVEPDVVRSTRRGGGPITALKRFLLRMGLQYHNEQNARIGRFNVHLLAYAAALEDRVARLEARLKELERGRG